MRFDKLTFLVITLLWSHNVLAADWPEFLGPGGTAKSGERASASTSSRSRASKLSAMQWLMEVAVDSRELKSH